MNIYPVHIGRLSLLAFAAATVALAGCTDDADIDDPVGSRPSDYLSFTASIAPEDASAVSRSSSPHLDTETTEWALQTMPANGKATRGSLATFLSGDAGVMGFMYNTGEAGKTQLNAENNNIEFTFNGVELAAAGTPIRWNTIDKDNLDIFAYAPRTVSGLAADSDYAPTLAYTVPAAVADHKDIIVSMWRNTDADYKNKTIPLTFDHALTAVRFKVGFDCTVLSVTVSGVHGSGTYAFSSGEWVPDATSSADYTIDFGAEGKNFARNAMLTDGDNTMILIPQTLPADAKITLTCTDRVLTAAIGGRDWEAGKLITYTLYDERSSETVYFDLALANVIITGSSYSGKIHKGGATIDVTGTHKAGNRYYVYQSTPANINSIWNGDVFTSPAYGEVKGPDSRPWREYITNNPDVDAVIDAWSKKTSGSPGNDYLAAAAGRSGTNYRIDITGNVTCELTIDNIYSTYQDGSPTTRTTAGIAFKPIGTDHSVKNAKVSINIVGDNRVGAVHYANRPANGNEIIFEGSGSLTVADVDGKRQAGSDSDSYIGLTSGSSGYWSNHWSSAIGGNDSGNVYEEDSYGIVINNGIIFAGTTKVENCTALGGGGNRYGGVTINGGTVTAVATTTGTAIGGGIGFGNVGGLADVIITGGNVYAYNHANRWNSPSSAIGGGGSVSNTANGVSTVSISGGYVYAESALGTAIGGGSSKQKAGGDVVVNITGGEVIARTLSPISAAIGGGTAYSQGGSSTGFNGGYAKITISGDPIIRTGSIGGGGTGDTNGSIGNATINISGGDTQAQFILAAGTGAGQIPSFTMTGGTIRNSDTESTDYLNVKPYGGAVYLENGTIDISGGTIKNCRADRGGAIYISGAAGSSSFTMSGGTIQGNMSNSDGGAIYMEGGQVTLSGGTVADNLAGGGNGGGIFIEGGSLEMPAGGDAAIQNNSAEAKRVDNAFTGGNGGGVYISSATTDVSVALSSGTISHNTADRKGGGVCVDMEQSSLNADVAVGTAGGDAVSPNIFGNHALMSGGGLYAGGTHAHITIDSGTIMDNTVSQYVYNQNVANELGEVTLNEGEVTHNVVTFHSNGGLETAPHKQKIVTSTNSKLIAPEFHRTGYKIVSWNTKPGGRGTSYTDGQIMNINTDITLYAQWAVAVQ